MGISTQRIFVTLLCSLLMFPPTSCGNNIRAYSTPKGQPTAPLPTAAQTNPVDIFSVCTAPCWENITPGISTEDDVVKELERLLAERKFQNYRKSVNGYTAYVMRGGNPVSIVLENNLVVLITVEDTMYEDVRIEEIINQLGEPEAYLGKLRPEPRKCPCDPWNDAMYEEAPSIYPNLIYPSKGLVITMVVPVEYIGCICPKMKAGLFYFFPPASMKDVQNDPNHLLVWSFDMKPESISQWHGFGSGY